MEDQTGESIAIIQNRVLEAKQLEKMGAPDCETLAKTLGLAAATDADRLESSQMILDIQKKLISQRCKLKKFH